MLLRLDIPHITCCNANYTVKIKKKSVQCLQNPTKTNGILKPFSEPKITKVVSYSARTEEQQKIVCLGFQAITMCQPKYATVISQKMSKLAK